VLKKKCRLTKNKDFKEILRNGRLVAQAILVLRYLTNNSLQTKIGFVVSGKVSKKAVARNLIKRRLREAVKIFLPFLKPRCTCVFLAKPAIKDKDFWAIKMAVGDVLKRAGLMETKNAEKNNPKHY
jgi:ribonuclease P protein component